MKVAIFDQHLAKKRYDIATIVHNEIICDLPNGLFAMTLSEPIQNYPKPPDFLHLAWPRDLKFGT